MALYLAFLKAVGKAALNAVGGGIAGDVLVEVLPEVAKKVCAWWGAGKSPEERQAAIEALANAPPAEFQAAVDEAVNEVARGKPAAVKKQLSIYLSLLPGAARASLRRGGDSGLDLDDEDDIVPLLPAHLPRFRPGDRPLPGIDWELEELLGAGGFGEVWKARNPHFDGVPPVALKFCLDPDAKDSLLRHEAAILNQVMRQGRHPGIVPLLHTYLSADPPCLEYEYVAGGDLAGLISTWHRHPPGAERIAELIRELAAILAFAHRLNPPIVHRDLKPANILLTIQGLGFSLRVADFGIGGLATRHARAVSVRGVSRGNFLVSALAGAHTPLYASPQQMRGDHADPRDDVYSIGVIWYQMLSGNLTTGRPGGSRWTSRLKDAGVSEGHIELLTSCLEDDLADRPEDAGTLVARLTSLASPAKPAAPKPALAPKPAPKPPSPAPLPALAAIAPKPMPRDLPRQLTNSLGMRFVLIPAGLFTMGSPPEEAMRSRDEDSLRRVRIDRPFYLGIHPVTQRHYEAVMKSNPSRFDKKHGGGPEHPVEQVSWEDCVTFCRKLGAMSEEKKAGHVYRLPSEAEWEYACRAGTTTVFAFSDVLSSTQANFDGNRPYGDADVGPFLEKTSKVGSYAANVFGLYDMHGNVWEWCDDWHTPGTHRVLRGGSWNNSGHLCRSARRQKYAPDFRGDNVGFRVVLEV